MSTPATPWLQQQWQALQRSWQLHRLADGQYRFLFEPPPANEWVALDCETTGLNPLSDEIVSIGAVRIVGERILTSERLELLVRPQKGVRADSVRIHRLRSKDLEDGLECREAMHRLLHFIGSRPLVGYYLEFDVAMLNRALAPLLGTGLPQQQVEISGMYYDYKLAQIQHQAHLGSPQIDLRFDTLMQDLGLPQRDAHDALNDAVMAALAFIKLRRWLHTKDAKK